MQEFASVLPQNVHEPGTATVQVAPDIIQQLGLAPSCIVYAGTTGNLLLPHAPSLQSTIMPSLNQNTDASRAPALLRAVSTVCVLHVATLDAEATAAWALHDVANVYITYDRCQIVWQHSWRRV